MYSFPGPLAVRTAAKPVPAGSRQHTRDNLRIGTYGQNNCNRRPRGKTSQYKGVTYDSKRNKYRATAWKDGRSFTIGRYDDEIEAARAADRKNYELNGEFAYLNFPEEIEKNVTTESPARPPAATETTIAERNERRQKRGRAEVARIIASFFVLFGSTVFVHPGSPCQENKMLRLCSSEGHTGRCRVSPFPSVALWLCVRSIPQDTAS